MASKKRGGLSKREYAAAQKAKAAPKVSTRATASKSVAPLVGAGPLQTNQVRVGSVVQGAGPLLPNQTRDDSYSGDSSKSSGSSSSKSSSSNRSKATPLKASDATPFKGMTGGSSAPQSTISAPKPVTQGSSGLSSIMASLGKMWGNNGLAQASPNAFLSPEQRQSNLNAGLGIEGVQASGPSALGLALAKGSLPDSPTGSGASGETYYNGYDPATDGAMMFQSDFAPKGTNFSRPGSEQAYLQGTSPIEYGRDQRVAQSSFGSAPVSTRVASSQPSRTPRSIAGDFTAQQAPQASFQPTESQVTPYRPELDFTPVSQGQPGTNRRFLGNGYLSNGIASNGKLDSGFDGASFGENPMDNEENLINQLLGIKTAQASDMPQSMSSFAPQASFAQPAFSPYASNMGETAQGVANRYQSMFGNPVGQNEQTNNTRVQNPGGSQNGGVTQNFAQGATGGDPMDSYYNSQLKGQNKAFSAQEKAQKKALNELLKSITNQYKTQQTTGIDQLAKSKQEDLLKLSGLFQFANQDPDSEQRIQYEQRANQDYAGQQGDFLAKLAAAQAQEESRARQGYQTQMSDIAGQRNDARSKIEELIFNARQAAQKGKGGSTRALSGTAAGSVTYMGDNASGEPVYRNNQTGEMQVGAGLTRKSQDPYAQMLAGVMGQQSGPQVQYDENGRPYIEQ